MYLASLAGPVRVSESQHRADYSAGMRGELKARRDEMSANAVENICLPSEL